MTSFKMWVGLDLNIHIGDVRYGTIYIIKIYASCFIGRGIEFFILQLKFFKQQSLYIKYGIYNL